MTRAPPHPPSLQYAWNSAQKVENPSETPPHAMCARRGTRPASAVRAPFTHPQVCHYVVFETTQGASPEYLITNLPLPFGLRERLFLEYNELDVPPVVASQDKGFRIIDIDGRCERAGAPLQRSESTQRATRALVPQLSPLLLVRRAVALRQHIP